MAPKPSPAQTKTAQKPTSKSDVDQYTHWLRAGDDPALIATFKDVTKGNPDAKLGKIEAQKILDTLLGDSVITEKEAQAMNDILLAANFDDAGLDLLISRVVAAIKSEALIKGATRIPGNSTMISGITEFLGIGNVGKLKFASPGTKIAYTPHYYLSIKQLIEQEQIWVYQIAAGGLNLTLHTEGGDYFSGSNRFVLYDNFDPISNAVTTIHEATHAVQDWLDVKTTVRFSEADAYIAGAVVGFALGWNAKHFWAKNSPSAAALDGAVDLVRKGQANDPNDKKWTGAYKLVTDAVARHALYKSIIDDPFAPNADDLYSGQESEEKRFNALLQTIIKKFPEKAAEVKKAAEKPAKNKKK